MGRTILSLALTLACTTLPSPELTSPEIISLVIENDTKTDVTVYLISPGGKRQRMGLVNANRAVRFPVSLSDLRETPRILIRHIADGEWMTDALHPVLPGGSIRLELAGLGGVYGFLSYR